MDRDDNNHPTTPISSIGHPETTSFPSPPSFVLPLSMAPPSPKSPPFSPFLGFDCFESELQPNPELGGGGSLSDVPQPLGTLYETPIPPFLSKTYDLVDDPSLDAIISWGAKGESFVVWDPVEFARMILPRNFKHNNFSSFVRQLNTYGFRKIDTDKWEFANEGFRKGQRHMLKNIQRRKSHNSQPIVTLSGSPHDSNKVSLEAEIERLRRERSSMMQEVVELQHQQRGTIQHMGIVDEKLQTAEKRQKQMVSFLGKIFHNPVFLARLQQKKEQKTITSPRAIRKFLKHQPQEMGTSGLDPKGQILRYPLLEMVDSGILGTKDVPFQVEDDREMMSGSLGTSEQAGPDPVQGTVDILLNGNDVVGPQARCVPDCFIPFPEDLGNKKNFPNSKIPESESSMATEDGIWSMGFETGIHVSSSTNDLWGNVNGYNLQDLGYLSGIWELDAVQLAGSSGVERWLDEDSPFNKFENNESQPRNDIP